jgi:putative ABC transport system permease protein
MHHQHGLLTALGLLAAAEAPAGAKPLEAWQVGLAVALVLISGGISLAVGLGLERRLAVASVRTVAQLLAVGFVLQWVFAVQQWPVVLLMALAMTLIAGLSAVHRVGHRYRGSRLDSVFSVWSSSWVVAAVALLGIVQPEPWYRPQYAITLLGMILGNTLNGISLGMERLGTELENRRGEVETLLALGATRWEAARGPVREAIRTGMVPTINSMMVVGLVSLPGMMTGQLLAEGDPMKAVEYQIVIMFLIAAGSSLGTFSVVLLGYRRLFNRRHQFLYGRVLKR